MENALSWLLGLVVVGAIQMRATAAPLTIQVQNVQSTAGPIHIGMFNSEAAWESATQPTPTSVLIITDMQNGTSQGQFDVPPGDYAFFLFDDLNNNGVMPTSGFGFPAEPYAFSNDVQLGFSKPAWSDIKFTVGASGATQNVTLVDP